MALPLAVPVALGIGRAAVWGYRAYQAHRATRAAQAVAAAAQTASAAERARRAAELARAAAAAQSLAQSQAREEPCGDCDPKCKDLADEVKQALYRNKRAAGNGGSHGYLNRIVEQMCGQSGPGTQGWRNHIAPLRGEQNRIANALEKMRQNGCGIANHFSRDERVILGRITGNNQGWSPSTIPWKGPGHPDCLNVSDAVRNGRLGDYLGVIRP